jgi:hypothetical protein
MDEWVKAGLFDIGMKLQILVRIKKRTGVSPFGTTKNEEMLDWV